MAQRKLKPETKLFQIAQKVTDLEYTHVIGGVGYLYINSENPTHPLLVLSLIGNAGELISSIIKSKPVTYYINSINRKYGKGKISEELINYAYNQGKLDTKGRLVLSLDFSEESPTAKFKDLPYNLTDNMTFQDDHLSQIQCAFFNLLNYTLQSTGKSITFAIDMQYSKDSNKITFEQFKEELKGIKVL